MWRQLDLARLRRLARGRTARLAALALLGLAVMAFVQIADEVLEGEWRWLDEELLLALRTDGQPAEPIGPLWVEELVRDVTALGGLGIVVGMTAAVCGYLVISGKRGQALLVLVAVTGGAGVSTLLKALFDRPRPGLVAHGVEAYQASFPSGHSMMAAVVYLTLGVLLARLQGHRRQQVFIMGAAALVVLAVGLSRIYLGVHWPTDVAAGWAAGVGWAAVCWLAALWLQPP